MKHLEIQRDEGVVTCTLSNPPTHTLTATGVLELLQMMDEMEADPSVRVLVLTGGGEGIFVAHYEVGELADSAEQQVARPTEPIAGPSAPSAGGGEDELHPLHQLILRLERADFITVAALNGSAAGGGCELSLGCDFRLMAAGSFLYGLPETLVGIIPGAGGTQRFSRLLGTARALDLILRGHLLTPREALELGLVHRLYPADSFRREVAEFASDLAGRAPIALAAAKRAIRQGAETTLEAGLAVEQDCFNRTMRSKDAAGAMRAWLKGETWQWRGE
jgi:enoyl-CoA hydratase